jgi:hypothetical protein
MPSIAYDPSQTGQVTASADSGLPEDQRRRFAVRFLTVRQNLKVRELGERGFDAEEYAGANAAINEALAMLLAGWSNVRDCNGQEMPFGPDRFDDLGTMDEKRDLLVDLVHGMRFAELDKKKSSRSGSPSPAAAAPSAEAAQPAPPDASSRPRRKRPG